MNGIVIESKPLTSEQAAFLVEAVNSLTIKADGAASILSVIQSLERIVSGQDVVNEVKP